MSPVHGNPEQLAALLELVSRCLDNEPDDTLANEKVDGSARGLHAQLGRRLDEDDYDKLTVRLAPGMLDELRRLAGERDCTLSEYLRRTVVLDRMVWDEHGGVMFVRGDDGDLVQITALPPKDGSTHGDGS